MSTIKRDNANGCIQVSGIFDEFTGAPVVDSSLVLWLDAAQTESYPGTGTTWTDLSGNENNGTLVNTPTFNTSGNFRFDYTQFERVTFANAASLQFLDRSPYTLEAWVYPTRNPGASNWTGIFDRESTFNSARDGYNIYFLGSATINVSFATERFASGGFSVTYVSDENTILNKWQHIVATYNGTTLSLYHNAISRGTPITSTGNITNNTKELNIGLRGGNYFDGNISNARIYNKALTATEISINFNALRGRFGI